MTEPIVTFVDVDVDGADRAALVAFLSTNRFPFHVRPAPSAADIERQLSDGEWGGVADPDGDHRTLWVVRDDERVGVLRLDDLGDDAPLFDIRLADGARAQGIGRAALRAATNLVFADYPRVQRFEGQTREDNLAMRRAFQRNGWTKEAHHRRAWSVPGASPVATVAYAILRSEWQTGVRVPLVWDDLPD